MYAIVDIAGQQFKVEKDQKIFVHRLDGDEGSKVSFDKVLLVDNDGKVDVGTPVIAGTIVTASIVSHLKGDKVKVFKKKRRKGYQVLNGHRQSLTEIRIESIGEGTVAKAAAKKEAAPKTEAAPKAKSEVAEKKPAAKKPAAKKPAAKTTTATKKPAAKAAPKAKKADDKSE
ncbi:MAG: 50S ribosomal protein L21 [Bacteroidales bacterium]|nr:50S ribosomal protein L21 [Bacteroidales bacterium]